jgi:hypothetical protein
MCQKRGERMKRYPVIYDFEETGLYVMGETREEAEEELDRLELYLGEPEEVEE